MEASSEIIAFYGPVQYAKHIDKTIVTVSTCWSGRFLIVFMGNLCRTLCEIKSGCKVGFPEGGSRKLLG